MANPALEHFYAQQMNPSTERRVTLDDIVQKTAISLGLVFLFAAATWTVFTRMLAEGSTTGDYSSVGTLYAVGLVASLSTLGLSLLISFKKTVSPPLILLFAALEGVVLGIFSKGMALEFGNELIVSAVTATFITAASTLAVYKFFNVSVSDRMRKYVMIGMFSFVGIMLLDFVFMSFGASLGVGGLGPMGFVFSLIGLGLALFMLVVDFDSVEKAVEYGAPADEAWRLAFGLTVTLVWIYVNIVRLLAILRGSD